MTTIPTMKPAPSTDEVRSRFPALERRHNGSAVAYFDGPGGTQVPQSVVNAMSDYLLHHNANTHWVYPTSIETDAMLAEAREALGDFLGGRASEIAFGANMTTLTFHLGRALGQRWSPGDEVVVTELDHHANSDPWRHLAKERGLTVRSVRFHAETGQLDMDDLAAAIGPKTKLLAIGAASNLLGTINPVRRAADLAHAAGALVFVDAVHYAPHALVDAAALGADFLACSAYKFYGPHIGAASAVDFLASFAEVATRRARLKASFAMLHARGQELLERLWSGLRELPGVTVYGPQPGAPRTPTIAFTVRGMPSEDVARALAERAVFVSNGDFYAPTAVARLGHAKDGVVRAGCACYTTADEVDRLVDGVRGLARRPA